MSVPSSAARSLDFEVPRGLCFDYSETAPIAEILDGASPTDEKVRFCYEVFKLTLDALLTRDYFAFDAKTTSNCCHGMAVLSSDLISSTRGANLLKIRQVVEAKLQSKDVLDPKWDIPLPLIQLSQLYTLTYVRDFDMDKGVWSNYKKLQQISKLGSGVCVKFAQALQKKYSNIVAHRYTSFLDRLDDQMPISGVPVRSWGRYLSTRTDSRDISYAPCMYSMQVTLAYLIAARAKIAILNDITNATTGQIFQRYIRLFEGNGRDGFQPIDLEAVRLDQIDESVIVYGGCSKSEFPDRVVQQMEEWLRDLPRLILACDTQYPMFPEVKNDTKFNRDPLIPDREIQEQINRYQAVEGISAADRSLYFLYHIYPSSLQKVIERDLPTYRAPTSLSAAEATLASQ